MNFYWCIALARARPGLVRGSNEENLLKKVRKMGMTDIKGEAVTAMTGNFFFLLFAWTFTVWVDREIVGGLYVARETQTRMPEYYHSTRITTKAPEYQQIRKTKTEANWV